MKIYDFPWWLHFLWLAWWVSWGLGTAGTVCWGTSVLCVTSPWYYLELAYSTVISSIPRRPKWKLQQASPNLRSQTASLPQHSIAQSKSPGCPDSWRKKNKTLPLEGVEKAHCRRRAGWEKLWPSSGAGYHIRPKEKPPLVRPWTSEPMQLLGDYLS